LLERGVKYDHSLMHHDHQPYYVRVGDSWTKIDYSKHPKEWMVPLQRGQETDLIEIPASWYLDDLPPMLFIKKSSNSHSFVNPRDIEKMWRDQFDWVYREYHRRPRTHVAHGSARSCDRFQSRRPLPWCATAVFSALSPNGRSRASFFILPPLKGPSPSTALPRHYAKVCTITGPATAVAGPVSRGARFCSIHASPRLLDSSAPA
jgi:hypothetical protein